MVGRFFGLLVLVSACLGWSPRTASAQAVPAAYGLVTGTVSGIYVSTAIFVAKARTGAYIYSLDDALAPRWELIPVAIMPIGSLVVGLDDGQRLANSVRWAAAGFATGAVVGLGLGTLLRADGGEGQWAGAIIGSAAGLLAGTLYGLVSYDGDQGDPSGGPMLTFRITL